MCAVLLPANAVEDKLGAEEVGGREYWWDPDDRDKHIRVPRSNAQNPVGRERGRPFGTGMP